MQSIVHAEGVEILPECEIRSTALNGGSLVPKKGSDAEVVASSSK